MSCSRGPAPAIHTTFTGDLRGRWDRARLEQVVANLVTNALEYGAGKPVEIVAERRGDDVHLTVRDHGNGIAPEDQARIFDRFERAVPSRHFGGLGLWIAREIVEAHRGTISVTREPGAGATFRVVLPVAPPG